MNISRSFHIACRACLGQVFSHLQEGAGSCRVCGDGSQWARCWPAAASPLALPVDWSPGRLFSILEPECTSTTLNIKSTPQSPITTLLLPLHLESKLLIVEEHSESWAWGWKQDSAASGPGGIPAKRARGRAGEACQGLQWKGEERKAGEQDFSRVLVKGACASARGASSSCKLSKPAGRMLTATMVRFVTSIVTLLTFFSIFNKDILIAKSITISSCGFEQFLPHTSQSRPDRLSNKSLAAALCLCFFAVLIFFIFSFCQFC